MRHDGAAKLKLNFYITIPLPFRGPEGIIKLYHMKKYTLLAALAFSALTVTATPKENTSQGNPQEMDKFITELMGKMTLHEKIGQLNLPVTGNIVTGQAKSSDVAGKSATVKSEVCST